MNTLQISAWKEKKTMKTLIELKKNLDARSNTEILWSHEKRLDFEWSQRIQFNHVAWTRAGFFRKPATNKLVFMRKFVTLFKE